MNAFDEAKQLLFATLIEVEESSLCCNICAEPYNETTNKPMLFRCKHTYCMKCINKQYHFKAFGGVDGLCVMDRTERLEGVMGEENFFVMQCIRHIADTKKYLKELEERDLSKEIVRLKQQNERSELALVRTSQLLETSEKSVRRLKAMIELQAQSEGTRAEIQEKLNWQRTTNFQERARLADIREQIRTAKRETDKARTHMQKAMMQAESELKEQTQKPRRDRNAERKKRKNRKKGKATDSEGQAETKDVLEDPPVQILERRSAKPLPNPFNLLNAEDSDDD